MFILVLFFLEIKIIVSAVAQHVWHTRHVMPEYVTQCCTQEQINSVIFLYKKVFLSQIVTNTVFLIQIQFPWENGYFTRQI